MFDVIVVGARCAGAATAMLLARRGWRVLLVDKARELTESTSTLYIQRPGVMMLREWGLLPQVIASGCPGLERTHYEVNGVRLVGGAAGGEVSYAPRRGVLDPILVEAAVGAGAEFRAGCAVTDLVWHADRVAGVRLGTSSGLAETVRAPLVVGADGMRSTVANLLSAPVEVSDPRRTCVYYSVWADLPACFETYERTGNWIAVIPTNDALTIVATYVPQSAFAAVRLAPFQAHHTAISRTAPQLYERMRTATQVERLRGRGDQFNFFRQAAGSGWALAGDAGVHKDSITARGITDAFVQADLLNQALDVDPGDPAALRLGLTGYADSRNRALAESYRGALALAELRVTESRLSMLRAISESTELTELYFAVTAGLRTMDDLLVPELLERL
ncbi:FAD-dependent oxidoreductase [Mangrovihabitans endophyticus]|uniref:FAD-dependent oxidoreductase n=1 Tax=Mangrovihabitans endophyticus TaxID=1751298 RepID=A0A8J3BVN9_9ACTN|nr:FAD-dependent monooxygenase [Mangrovihabitans endophyticus]GGK72640.1 FAD-dependent oxidoreductase [Mangrovihabitans endophyticus]